MNGVGPRSILTIDGPSGAGKSTFATKLAEAHPDWVLVSMDDVYPGWTGMYAAVEQIRDELIAPIRAGQQGEWTRYDWELGSAVARFAVEADSKLIIEGCGATVTVPESDAGIRQLWLDIDEEQRRERILQRDGTQFDEFWPIWDAQWDDYMLTASVHRRVDHFFA